MSTLVSSKVPARKGSSLGSSSEDTFPPDSQDVPMGNISKTTHVDVQYGGNSDGRMESHHPAMMSPKTHLHTKSLSATHLVGDDLSFP